MKSVLTDELVRKARKALDKARVKTKVVKTKAEARRMTAEDRKRGIDQEWKVGDRYFDLMKAMAGSGSMTFLYGDPIYLCGSIRKAGKEKK